MEESFDKSNVETTSVCVKDDTAHTLITPVELVDTSQNLFSESPVYDPDEDLETIKNDFEIRDASVQPNTEAKPEHGTVHSKRKLTEEISDDGAKVLKLDITEEKSGGTLGWNDSQSLDDEVSSITSVAKRKLEDELPSTSRVRTPVRSSPRKITKRSNSVETTITPKRPRTPKPRSASVDISKNRKTPKKSQLKALKEISEVETINSCNLSQVIPETITEETQLEELNDSQNMRLVLSPSPDKLSKVTDCNSEPVVENEKNVILETDVNEKPNNETQYNSDLHILSKSLTRDFEGQTTDQDSTRSVSSMGLDSPEQAPISMASKLISKLSNGNSSTPTEISTHQNVSAENITPDIAKMNGHKGQRGKNESYRVSNNTTPSTISPLQNGHSLPINTPQIPVFDIHITHNEENEFLSLYVVRTDNDIGMDMCKEYQRISKRFTTDPYLGDVSLGNSPSSVTSGGLINLPNRTSFASTVSSSSSSSNRTSDGAFVVPQPPRKSISNPSTSVKGYETLMKKLQEIFSHIRDVSAEDINRSMNEDKISIGIQTSEMSNGSASPAEVSKCDKATPKSSLKKSRVRGRRPMAGKTKRALLPTQHEEAEFAQNSPNVVSTNGDSEKISPVKSPKDSKDDKPLSSLVGTPKSISKLKQKRRPTSPRPATPVEKVTVKQEYSGFPPDTVVLAKWVDKRYYSGKVLEMSEPNKYLIKFDDGQSKVLLDDFIIFGDMKKLPLQGQSVYALVDEEQNYEPGLVLGVEENNSGTVTYRCTTDGDTIVMVTASELYQTEDQARSMKESARPGSPSTPSTPRRRHNRELDLDNIIQGPRSARTRDKGNSSARKRVASPKSPKASTSVARKRLGSESSEMSESSNSAPPVRLEEVAGVEPEVQKTPRKIDGVKAGPLQLKGAAKQNIGKKNSKLTKFENDEHTVSMLGPIPSPGSTLFAGLHFLLTCTDQPRPKRAGGPEKESDKGHDTRHYSSEEDGETTSSMIGTDTEDLEFCNRPFNKERLREQLEAGGATVYSYFDDVPKNKYSVCKLIAPRPCLTMKYILCLAADIRAVSHAWPIVSCIRAELQDLDAFVLPTGFSIQKNAYVNWVPPFGKRNTTFFKDKVILICGDQDTFVKFWDRVCTLAGATTRVVNEEDLNMSGAYALVTDWDCPHEVQNKANQDNIPLVSTTWVKQCLIEGKVLPPTSHDRFSFLYTETE
ncbi:uncharacterized protein LOC126968791 isoform X2 [Leptidea sinapis]|uniref:uncharacterized protein LOC126968791 isoform X2 n=1 Tax=Leptidea sinapis TaxID=189913 RepID=UPI0021C46C93|nr:uncharacterized protein LOC126968791 isoform X2 [Leptidea sinapis]